MRRRTFIAGTAGAVGALAGCGALGGDGGSSGPRDPVESFVEGYTANDSEAAQGAVHPDGPLAQDLPRSVDDRQLELANATVVSEANGTATIEANVSIRGEAEQWYEPREFEVHEQDGEWKLWSMETGPELALDAFFGALEAGRTDAATDRLHPDSPSREWLDSAVVEHATPTLESASLATFRDDEATMDVTFTETVGEETAERSRQLELRRTDDGWRVWSLRFGPVVPIYKYVRALDENDPDLFQAAVHPESPEAAPDLTESDLETISASIISTEVVDGPDEGVATVETEISIEWLGEATTDTTEIEVRAHEGDWQLYE